MTWPDSFVPDEIDTQIADELLALTHQLPCSARLRCWLEDLNRDAQLALSQIPLFGAARGPELGDDWMPVQ